MPLRRLEGWLQRASARYMVYVFETCRRFRVNVRVIASLRYKFDSPSFVNVSDTIPNGFYSRFIRFNRPLFCVGLLFIELCFISWTSSIDSAFNGDTPKRFRDMHREISTIHYSDPCHKLPFSSAYHTLPNIFSHLHNQPSSKESIKGSRGTRGATGLTFSSVETIQLGSFAR